jgi:hypothetical protein
MPVGRRDAGKPAKIGLMRQFVNMQRVDHPHAAKAYNPYAQRLNGSLD